MRPRLYTDLRFRLPKTMQESTKMRNLSPPPFTKKQTRTQAQEDISRPTTGKPQIPKKATGKASGGVLKEPEHCALGLKWPSQQAGPEARALQNQPKRETVDTLTPKPET